MTFKEYQQEQQRIIIDRWFTGLYTHRSPLMTPFSFVGLNVIFRRDALLDGADAELTDLFTLRRRFGFSAYCSQALAGGEALRYAYTFKDLTGAVHLLADLTANVSVISPTVKSSLIGESATSSRCTMQYVANTLYLSNGTDQKKWLINPAWAASTVEVVGNVITDSGGNIQQVTAVTGDAKTGTLAPSWAATVGTTTTDNHVTWTCRGYQVQGIGVATPTTTAKASFVPFQSGLPSWAANTYYTNTVVIIDSNGNIELLTTPGTTGASAPSWNVTVGGTTTDGTAIWTNKGPGAWAASHAYPAGSCIQSLAQYQAKPGDPIISYWLILQNLTDGTSGTSNPIVPSGPIAAGQTISDGFITWLIISSVLSSTAAPVWTTIGASKVVGSTNEILDSNKNIQQLSVSGTSGASAPTWATAVGATTTDNTVTWICQGPASPAGSAPWYYSYAYKASATGHIGSRSPRSLGYVAQANFSQSVQGAGCPDSFYDTVEIYRTKAGGSVDYLLAEIPNATIWTYLDSTTDANLQTQEVASIGQNDPPPAGLTNLCFHAGRLWGSMKNVVYFASGPDTTIGVPEEAWNVLNYFVFPGDVIALYPIQGGLLVFLQDDLWEILGADSSSFYAQLSQAKLGIANPDAVAFDGTNLYIYTSLGQLQLVSGSGNTEVGFNVADVLNAHFPPASTSLTVLRNGVNESALYVSNGAGNMMRFSLTTQTWSTIWNVTNNNSNAWAVEVSPQQYKLLTSLGTSICQRDTTLYTDLGNAYAWWFLIGTLDVAESGSMTEMDFVAMYLRWGGNMPTISYLADDIIGTFSALGDPQVEPPLLPQGSALNAYRWYFNSNTTATPTVMQHLQIKVNFAAAITSDEIFKMEIVPKGPTTA